MLVLSLLVVVLDNTVLNVALRTIADPARGLGASQAQLEWAINSYTLVFAGLLFTAGVLGDRWGRRRILIAGLMIFGLASLASAYSQTPVQLIAARSLMGLGAAAVLPSTLSIISNVFDPRERGRAIGVWAGAVGLGVAIGPVVGGALLERFWWGSVFLINVPIIAVGTLLVLALVPESRNPRPGRLDLSGVVLSIAALLAFVYGIIYGGDHGFDRALVWLAVAVSAALLAWFIRHERRIDHPSLNLALFRDARFSAAIGSIGLVFFAAFGTLFFLSFYFQLVRGYSPLKAGLLMTPFAAAQLIFAPRSATMVRRYGPRAVCAVGLALVTIALAGFALVGTTTAVWLLLVLTFVQGTGMANVVPPTTESIMSSLPREQAGIGSAMSNIFRQVGGALGVAVLGSVLAAVYRRHVGASLQLLPAPVRSTAGESISGAYAVAPQAGSAGPQFLSAANEAFVSAMHWAAGGSAVVAAAGVGVVLTFLPRRANPLADHRRPAQPPAAQTRAPQAQAAAEPVAVDPGGQPGEPAPAAGRGGPVRAERPSAEPVGPPDGRRAGGDLRGRRLSRRARRSRTRGR